jgi:hypothetical protein
VIADYECPGMICSVANTVSGYWLLFDDDIVEVWFHAIEGILWSDICSANWSQRVN